MAYTRTTWVKNQTPLSAENFNNIEDALTQLDKLIYLDSSGVCQVGDSKGVQVASLNSLGDVTTSSGASLNTLNSDLNDFQNNFISTYIDVTGDGKNYFYYSPIPNYKLVSMVQMNDPDVAVDNLAYFNDNNIYIVRLINSMEVGKIYSFHVFYVKFGING